MAGSGAPAPRAGPGRAKGATMAGNDPGGLHGGLAEGSGGVLGALLGVLVHKGGVGNNPLDGLIDSFTAAGLGDRIESWVASGENQPVTGAQVRRALPGGTLEQVAAEAGVTPDQASDEIARLLPGVIDELTPDGQVPSASLEEVIRHQGL
ncbi:YidB family protein [Streptomyces longispororuber]|uniref:YidB family protein n=1 Tax=Streptomyces longispororuber TaxID=68230 RepID=UPI0036FEFF6F